MSNIYYTADLHFNHTFVAKTRAFQDDTDHDEDLIERFNSVLTKRDHLWILGDVFNGSITEGLKQVERLNGVKHLVIGNHDAPWPENRRAHNAQRRFLEVFETVQLHAQHRIGEHRVNLSHLPYKGDHKDTDRYTQWRLPDEGLPLLHGHVHQAWARWHNQINVGVDFNPYPLHRDHIQELLEVPR